MTKTKTRDVIGELVKLTEGVANIKPSLLDDLVHDIKSEEASFINNESRAAQVDYIVESMGPSAAREAIKKAIKEAKEAHRAVNKTLKQLKNTSWPK